MLLTDKVSQFTTDSNLVHAWVHGTDVVMTEGGAVRTPAKLIADKEIDIDAATTAAINLASDLVASTGASLVGYLPAGTGAVATTVQSKLRENVSVRDFGAVGDGVTDDTSAIQAALNSTAIRIEFPAGDYLVSNTGNTSDAVLTSALDGRTIEGPGVIVASAQIKWLLHISGDDTKTHINIDGRGFVGYAIEVSGANPTVSNCNIKNLNGFNNWGGVAIRLNFFGKDSGGVLSDNVIYNLQGVGDGSSGNGVGMQRGIAVQADQDCVNQILITGNSIGKVEGEEGDAIVVYCGTGGAATIYSLPVTISNNAIFGWSRRAVKVQASGVTTKNNTFSNLGVLSAGTLQRVVDTVGGGDSVVQGNTFIGCKYQTQVGVFYTEPEAKNNFLIADNAVYGVGAESASSPLFLLTTFGSGNAITGNKVYCPSYSGISVAAISCDDACIANNTIQTANGAWYSVTSTPDVKLSGNVCPANSVTDYQAYFTPSEYVVDVSAGRSLTLFQRDTALSSGEVAAEIKCKQNDASNPATVTAAIRFVTEGSSGLLAVGIATHNGTSLEERVRVTTQGAFNPSTDNTQTLGFTTTRWSVVYAGTGTINTSDACEKQQVRSLSDAERAVAVRIKGLIRAFKFNDAVLEKGDDARIHFGVVAQEVKTAFESGGLVAEKYALLCYDEWPEQQEEKDDNGMITQPYKAAGNRYGIRYEELLAFVISAL